jgi:hypothetical protein
MALHTDTTARTRLVTYEKNICPQCSAWLLAPDWSEHLTSVASAIPGRAKLAAMVSRRRCFSRRQ